MKCILSSILGSVYISLIHPLTIHVCSPHSISDSQSSILAPPCTHCVTEGKSQFPELYFLQCKSSFNSKYYIAFYLVLGEIIHVSSYFTVWHKEESRAKLVTFTDSSGTLYYRKACAHFELCTWVGNMSIFC